MRVDPISEPLIQALAESGTQTLTIAPEAGSGRAQWQDTDGNLHIVHVHTTGEGLRFGRRVRLENFDPETESYLVSTVGRRRRGPAERNSGP